MRKKLVLWVVVPAVSLFFAALLAEGLLRLLPIPGISYHTFYYDDVTGARYYPGSTAIYRSRAGERIRRRVNSLGFLDVEPDQAKAAGVVRIGFFGDSYTEARQVRIEDTFYRRTDGLLNAGREEAAWECLAFGVSGFGTLQSYLGHGRWLRAADLDYVVYVFVENDPGDQIESLKKSPDIPYASLSGDSFVVDDRFRQRLAYKNSPLHRVLQFAKAHSLVISTVVGRLKLLKAHGIKMKVTEADRRMSDKTPRRINSNTPPSIWPDSLRDYAAELGERIIARWAREVRAADARFVVAYVPRQDEIGKLRADQDSWLLWLADVCDRHGIDLIDPTPEFRAKVEAGEAVYDDHFTPLGHWEFARVIARYFASLE